MTTAKLKGTHRARDGHENAWQHKHARHTKVIHLPQPKWLLMWFYAGPNQTHSRQEVLTGRAGSLRICMCLPARPLKHLSIIPKTGCLPPCGTGKARDREHERLGKGVCRQQGALAKVIQGNRASCLASDTHPQPNSVQPGRYVTT